MISRFFTTQFTVKRMVYTGDKATLTTVGTINGHIQQLTQENIQAMAGGLRVSHSVWCAPTETIQKGDVLENGSDKYSVQAIQKNNSIGSDQHLEILVQQ